MIVFYTEEEKEVALRRRVAIDKTILVGELEPTGSRDKKVE